MLSLELLHTLTSAQKMELHVKVVKGSNTGYAKYGQFAVGAASTTYALTVAEFDAAISPAQDKASIANGAPWSTPSEYLGQGSNCAELEGSAFWLAPCHGEAMPLSLLWPDTDFNHADLIEWSMRPNPCPNGPSLACSGCSAGEYLCTTSSGQECCSVPLSSCEEALYPGVYEIEILDTPSIAQVWCDPDTGGGGWTSVLRRGKGAESATSATDFSSADWATYSSLGVGRPGLGEFFLALERLHALTAAGDTELLVELTSPVGSAFAYFSEFSIASAS